MSGDWQTIVALGVVAVAAAYVARCAWGSFGARTEAGCGGGCHGCASSKVASAPSDSLISLESLAKPIRKE